MNINFIYLININKINIIDIILISKKFINLNS